MSRSPASLHYVGIDEAGYGPMLGPLCVSAAAIKLEDWKPQGPAPDLWAMLADAVCRTPRDARGRVAFNDSKKLKLANNSKRRHPLEHLERGVLCALPDGVPETESSLLEALEVKFDDSPWYQPAWASEQWPLATCMDSLAIDRNVLHTSLRREGATFEAMRCEVLCETAYNRQCDQWGSKAEVNAACVSRLIECNAHADADRIRIVCDRQSGRTDYRGLVESAAGGRGVDLVAQTARVSAYRIEDPARDIVVRFEVEADATHLPVALASMTAKFVRELAMGRFNRFWSARLPGLEPTAGYTTDARRWLAEVGAHATTEERTRLIRRS